MRSKTKFWQMIGRGTRLCPDLFGPGRHKEYFAIFDFCQNFEFFNQNPETVESAGGHSLSKRLFIERVELIGELDRLVKESDMGVADPKKTFEPAPGVEDDEEALPKLRAALAERLHDEVSGMSLDNFLVRPKRALVEKFAKPDSWTTLNYDARAELTDEIAGLPTSLVDDDVAAKEFDLLMLMTQLAVLRTEKRLNRLKEKIIHICSNLEELPNVPAVAAQLVLIQEVQSDDFWQDVTLPMLETVRQRLRALVKLIEWKKRALVYSDFEDEIGRRRRSKGARSRHREWTWLPSNGRQDISSASMPTTSRSANSR